MECSPEHSTREAAAGVCNTRPALGAAKQRTQHPPAPKAVPSPGHPRQEMPPMPHCDGGDRLDAEVMG